MRAAAGAALLVALIATGPAAAQLATAAPKTPGTPAQTAAARSEADRVITAADAGDLFANATDGIVPRMRHLKSGLVCGFDPGDAGAAIKVYDSAGMPRGDDISCGHHLRDITLTLFVTRYPQPMTAHQVLQESVNAMHQRFTDMAFWTGDAASVKPQGKPGPPAVEPETVRIAAKLNGAAVFTRSSAAACRGWIIAQRVTVPVETALAADLAAELELNAAIEDVCGGGTKP